MSAPLVEVLMSTHNGARFVTAQVESVLAQRDVRVRLVVRDDASSDDTVTVLEGCVDGRIATRRGERLGVPAAYFHLLDSADRDADLWALADQDDIWLPDKLSTAARLLAAVEGPAMVCARVMVTDADLQPLYPHELPQRGPSFANALVQNIALGCTIVLNRPALDLVRGRWPAECVMHDAWLYLVIAGCGEVLYDEQVQVLYRQHEGNTVGMGTGPLTRLAGRVRRQLTPGGPGKHSRQDRELLRLYGAELRPQAREQLCALLEAQGSVRRRASYAVRGPAHRQTRGSDLVLKGLQVLGRV